MAGCSDEDLATEDPRLLRRELLVRKDALLSKAGPDADGSDSR
jgi:hypothetical protein